MSENGRTGDGFEAIEQPRVPEEACLQAMLDLEEVQKFDHLQNVHAFFETYTNSQAPEGLKTSMNVITRDSGPVAPGAFSPPGADVVAGVTLAFHEQSHIRDALLNFDFVNTTDGLRIFETNWLPGEDGQGIPVYTRLFNSTEVEALQADAEAIRQNIIEADMERIRLGPLAEEMREDGTRRFHVGDILAVMADKSVSPRGMEGVVDILQFMAGETPATTQIPRFIQECAPQLRTRYAELLKPYLDLLEEGPPRVSLYEWLAEISEANGGESLLEVGRLDPSQHAVMDHMEEVELDHGSQITEKIINLNDDTYNDRDDK